MTLGLYFNGLVESGQVERFDQDMKKVHDVGVAEIRRLSQIGVTGPLRAKLAEFTEAGKLTREEAAELFRIAFPQASRRVDRERNER